MERESRYLVLKVSDVEKHLHDDDRITLAVLAQKVDEGRRDHGKSSVSCVVVESDWPMYEETWGSIERFVDGNEGLSGDRYREKVEQITRAFWRRIDAYKDEYEKELPKPLPVEFRCSMMTALSLLDLESVMMVQEQVKQMEKILKPLNKIPPEAWNKFVG